MFSTEFLITSLIVVLMPGTGVIYTISIGLFNGKKESIFAAIGCTLGIVPHLLATVLGLAAILYASAVAFNIVKIIGVFYLLYLAYSMWKDESLIQVDKKINTKKGINIAIKAFLINILNPKLSIFFMAFLPQFISSESLNPTKDLFVLSLFFMFLTFIIFSIYGIFANKAREFIINSPKIMRMIQKLFASFFVIFSVKLAVTER